MILEIYIAGILITALLIGVAEALTEGQATIPTTVLLSLFWPIHGANIVGDVTTAFIVQLVKTVRR